MVGRKILVQNHLQHFKKPEIDQLSSLPAVIDIGPELAENIHSKATTPDPSLGESLLIKPRENNVSCISQPAEILNPVLGT